MCVFAKERAFSPRYKRRPSNFKNDYAREKRRRSSRLLLTQRSLKYLGDCFATCIRVSTSVNTVGKTKTKKQCFRHTRTPPPSLRETFEAPHHWTDRFLKFDGQMAPPLKKLGKSIQLEPRHSFTKYENLRIASVVGRYLDVARRGNENPRLAIRGSRGNASKGPSTVP